MESVDELRQWLRDAYLNGLRSNDVLLISSNRFLDFIHDFDRIVMHDSASRPLVSGEPTRSLLTQESSANFDRSSAAISATAASEDHVSSTGSLLGSEETEEDSEDSEENQSDNESEEDSQAALKNAFGIDSDDDQSSDSDEDLSEDSNEDSASDSDEDSSEDDEDDDSSDDSDVESAGDLIPPISDDDDDDEPVEGRDPNYLAGDVVRKEMSQGIDSMNVEDNLSDLQNNQNQSQSNGVVVSSESSQQDVDSDNESSDDNSDVDDQNQPPIKTQVTKNSDGSTVTSAGLSDVLNETEDDDDNDEDSQSNNDSQQSDDVDSQDSGDDDNDDDNDDENTSPDDLSSLLAGNIN